MLNIKYTMPELPIEDPIAEGIVVPAEPKKEEEDKQ